MGRCFSSRGEFEIIVCSCGVFLLRLFVGVSVLYIFCLFFKAPTELLSQSVFDRQ